MLNLFQADLPIGRRLWIILLVLVLSGALSNGVVSISDKPAEFVVQTLIFFGYTSIISFLISIPVIFIQAFIEVIYKHWKLLTDPYPWAVGKEITEVWGNLFGNIFYVIAVLISLHKFGKPSILGIGSLGVFLLLVAEVLRQSNFIEEIVELLDIRSNESGRIQVNLITKEQEERRFDLPEHWFNETASLLNKGWEVIDISLSENESRILLQRKSKEIVGINWLMKKRRKKLN